MSGRSSSPLPFAPEYRASGLLLHVTSLPSRFGIGDVGPSALAWIDRLRDAGQSWWQALPLGPTGYGNSPYQPLSSFAGNELLVSPDWMVEDGLLSKDNCAGCSFPPGSVDYEAAANYKRGLLRTAWAGFGGAAKSGLRAEYERFRQDQSHWLEDYALFRALKVKYKGAYFLDWPRELVGRVPSKIAEARAELADFVGLVCFSQWIIFRQADRLKSYARASGVRLIGDLPFFVSADSSDVWANPGYFLLNDQRRPRFVAGVPPDYFSADGQLWGNPVYDWDALRRTGYRWAIDRLRALLSHVDVIRLDHFRGFAAAWHIPAGAASARQGQWVPGPGADLLLAARAELGSLPFIAEDLGLITPDVIQLRDSQNLPGMRVLQFAFDGNPKNPHLPDNYGSNTVAYTGTHDNNTTRGWFDALSESQRQGIWAYLGQAPGDSSHAVKDLMQITWSSRAALAIAPLQDVLGLGAGARMNTPGQPRGNWRWEATDGSFSQAAFDWLRGLTAEAKRRPADFVAGNSAAFQETEVTR